MALSPHSKEDQRRVFLAFRPTFVGPYAELQKPEQLRLVIELDKDALQEALIEDFGVDKVVEILQGLFRDRVFDTKLAAAGVFPELFGGSMLTELRRLEMEDQAEIVDRKAMFDMVNNEEEQGGEAGTKEKKAAAATRSSNLNEGKKWVHLYPVYLPYESQYLALFLTKRILERVCFHFVENHMKDLLDQTGWDCPEAAALYTWARKISERANTLLGCDEHDHRAQLLREHLQSAERIFTCVVHRLRISNRSVDELLSSAVSLARVLEDALSAERLSSLRFELECRTDEFAMRKNLLQMKYEDDRKEIHQARSKLNLNIKSRVYSQWDAEMNQQRVKLDEREHNLRDLIFRQDHLNMLILRDTLNKTISKIGHDDGFLPANWSEENLVVESDTETVIRKDGRDENEEGQTISEASF